MTETNYSHDPHILPYSNDKPESFPYVERMVIILEMLELLPGWRSRVNQLLAGEVSISGFGDTVTAPPRPQPEPEGDDDIPDAS
jgi:hypothetical protein